MFWTEQQVARLSFLISDGWTYSQIASDMGTTRNAVGGKVDRLGLSATAPRKTPRPAHKQEWTPERRDLQRARRLLKRAEDMQSETIVAPPEYTGSLRIPFADLRDFRRDSRNECRYIADEPPGPHYFACGNETADGESYCAHCRPITLSKHTGTQEERAKHIHMGVRKHLRLIRKAA